VDVGGSVVGEMPPLPASTALHFVFSAQSQWSYTC
jgi:hypothetical protein